MPSAHLIKHDFNILNLLPNACNVVIVNWPTKTRHKVYLLPNESYLFTGIQYFHSVTCIKMPAKL